MCERKTAGLVRSRQVFNALPDAVFTLSQISFVDPRLDDDDSPTPRILYTIEMTAEEWDKLVRSAYKRASAE